MATRSRLLHEISQITGLRYLDTSDLKAAHPEYAAQFTLGTIDGLQSMLDHLRSGKPLDPIAPKPKRAYKSRKATLTPQQMRELRDGGMSLRAIGKLANITGEAARLAIESIDRG